MLWNRSSAVTSAAQTTHQKKSKHLDALRDFPLFNRHRAHTLYKPTSSVGMFREWLLRHKCVWHKTRPVCEYENLERMAASEEKEPVMSSPYKMPQTTSIIICLTVAEKWLCTHNAHDP